LASLKAIHRVVVRVSDGSTGGESARYRIKDIAPSIWDQSRIEAPSILGQSRIEEQFFSKTHTLWVYETGPVLSKSVEIRNTSPGTDKEFDKNGRRIVLGKAAPVNSLGKPAAMLLDLIHYFSRITGEYVPTPPTSPTPPEPSQEPRESRLSRPEEAPRVNVPEDEHPLDCDCLECSFPAILYARPAWTPAKAEHHDYASLVT
jgi:hypothetical protein